MFQSFRNLILPKKPKLVIWRKKNFLKKRINISGSACWESFFRMWPAMHCGSTTFVSSFSKGKAKYQTIRSQRKAQSFSQSCHFWSTTLVRARNQISIKLLLPFRFFTQTVYTVWDAFSWVLCVFQWRPFIIPFSGLCCVTSIVARKYKSGRSRGKISRLSRTQGGCTVPTANFGYFTACCSCVVRFSEPNAMGAA